MTTKTNLPIELQNEVIESFNKEFVVFFKQFNKYVIGENFKDGIVFMDKDKVEQFITQSLQKAYSNGYERGRYDVIDKLKFNQVNNNFEITPEEVDSLQSLSKETNEK